MSTAASSEQGFLPDVTAQPTKDGNADDFSISATKETDAIDPAGDEKEKIWRNLAQKLSPSDRKRYVSGGISREVKEISIKIQKLLLQAAATGPLRSHLQAEKAMIINGNQKVSAADYGSLSSQVMEIERKVRAAFNLYGNMFPSEVWHCCRSNCFAAVIIDSRNLEIVGKLRKIHDSAKKLREEIEQVGILVETRRKGVGGSNIAFTAPSREQREQREREEGRTGTDRQKLVNTVSDFIEKQLPYLYGHSSNADGTPSPAWKLCTEAITLLLVVSRTYLYHRKAIKASSEGRTELLITSLIDTACVLQRQHRRNGDRKGYPSVKDISTYDCGYEEPCFFGIPEWRLQRLFDEFRKRAVGLKPRAKEHQFLLDLMFCPLTNSTVKQCNRSLAMLFTVSEGLVGSIRRILDDIFTDPSLEDRPLRDGWEKLGYTYRTHPVLRYDEAVRTRIENYLNMVLRADPAGGTDVNVCRAYSPEVNTHEKLRSVLTSLLKSDRFDKPGKDSSMQMSASTMQRMINRYLEGRNLRISYLQTDCGIYA